VKILLLNDNPVVSKLVTLSAQKTSDELEVVSGVDEIEGLVYDLLVIDDGLYSDDLIDKIKDKIEYDKSLYICARDAAEAEGFTSKLKKPFLPTDLVELFLSLGKDASAINLEDETATENKEVLDNIEELEELEEFNDGSNVDEDDLEEVNLEELDEELQEDEDIEDLDEISLDDELDETDTHPLENFDENNESDNEPSEIEESLEDDKDGEDFSFDDLEDETSEGVLDIDELKEVQDLLEDTSAELDTTEELNELNELELEESDELLDGKDVIEEEEEEDDF